MGTKKIEVAKGLTLTVRRGVNADDLVTGRVDGKTYKGKTWAEVEEKIRKDYTDTREWTKYLVIRADLPEPERRCSYSGRFPERSIQVGINYMAIEATQPVHNDGQLGIFSREPGHSRPTFHRGKTDPVAALGWGGDATAVLVWSDALAAQVDALCDAVAELAARIGQLVESPSLAKVLMGGKLPFALTSGEGS